MKIKKKKAIKFLLKWDWIKDKSGGGDTDLKFKPWLNLMNLIKVKKVKEPPQ